MSDEVKPEVIKKTQDLLGKYFKSPPLTEKLLRKPPFRFLHDIISAVIKETGFLQGLFSEEELNSDNVKDKDSKVAYLTKLIEVVKLATGDSLTVRPSKIVAGQEPTKTNELLQSIGKALDKKINSKDAIEQFKKGKSKSKSEKDEAKKAKKSSHSKRPKENGNSTEKRPSHSDKEKVRNNKDKDKENEKMDNGQEKDGKEKPEKTASPVPEQKVERQASSTTRKSGSSSKVEAEKSKPRKKSISETSDSSKRPRSVKESASLKKRKPVKMQSSDSIPENEVVENKIGPTETEKTPPSQTEKDNEAKKEDKKTVIENLQEEPTDDIKPVEISSSSEVVRPKTSLRPPSARPPSARPAAPKMRAKTDFIINEELMTSAGNVNVIVENFDTKEDNAEDMVVMEAPRDPLQMQGIDNIDPQLSQEHGHLVAQILETQKELINTDNADVLPKKVEIEWEAGSRRDREATVKEVDKLRSTIQTITRAANPLRKLLDFVQEDVEVMQKELQDWKFQYEEFSKELEIEQTKTEQSIEPMKESLEDLKTNIKQQLNKIGQVKMNIIKNDQKIQRLLNGNF